MRWVRRLVAVLALAVVGWVALTAWPAVQHGHPAYAVLLAITVVGAVVGLVRRGGRRGLVRRVLGVVGLLLAVGWVVLMAWLRPFPAVEPALAAMSSDDEVRVTETATALTFAPAGAATGTALFFQPGARVDARAYAALLRPVAQGGTLVVVAKQPLGIGFLALSAFEAARDANPQVERWIVAGHSLGGTVATLDAVAHDQDPDAPVVGLVLWASYPAGDVRASLTAAVLSVSGSQDGLATPARIEASRAHLPAASAFVVVDGASHASFGDYGPQPGDGEPTISRDEARAAISDTTTEFVAGLDEK